MAEALGVPLMPWQRLVADVGGEVGADGLPVYREVVVTVPRQSGKTTLILAWELHRALMWGRPQLIAYTAQTGQDARKKLVDDQYDQLLVRSPLRSTIRQVKRAAADTAMIFKNGSRIDVLATSAEAGHGRTLDLGVIDEAFADEDFRREQALRPTMATRADAQVLVLSTAGTDRSVLLNQKQETGRLAVERGLDSGVAYFEWSAPDGVDVHDPDEWWGWMPALGRTITPAVVEADSVGMSDGEFTRAYGNRRTVTNDRVVSSEQWSKVVDADAAPQGPVVLAPDADPDRRWASVAAADALGAAELVAHGDDVGWLEPWLVRRAEKHRASVVVDTTGPVAYLADRLEAAGVKVVRVSRQEYAHACGGFFDRIVDRSVRVSPADPKGSSGGLLAAAVGAARKQPVGDQWVWRRKNVDSDISPLVAVSLAVYAASKPADAPVRLINLSEV